MISFEEFQIRALDFGYELYIDRFDKYKFLMDGVGVSYKDGKYLPSGVALCAYWTDDILSDRLRKQVAIDQTPEIALDYLELIASLERIENGSYTD